MKIIFSTVGTSLLTNKASKELRPRINKSSNLLMLDEQLLAEIQALKTDIESDLAACNEDTIKRISAELNSIACYYGGLENADKNDIHYLIVTDTYLGRLTGTILKKYLKKYFTMVEVLELKDFSTRNKESFLEGIKQLGQKCYEIIPGYRKNGYEIIFNLTGGFKSLIGYMNIFGMFYADKIVYIFETGEQLIEIPKLPIEPAPNTFEKHKKEMFYLEAKQEVNEDDLADMPEAFLDKAYGKAALSIWGQLLWNQEKETVGENLIEHPNLSYDNNFRKDFENGTAKDKFNVNVAIARASKILSDNMMDLSALKRDNELEYDKYTGKDVDHFRVTNQGDRISCLKVNNKLVLRHFGRHDYVNDNP